MTERKKRDEGVPHDHRERVPGCFRCDLSDDELGMCPNCVTPWKCNGPHLPQPITQEEED